MPRNVAHAAALFLHGVALATEAARLGLLLLSGSAPEDTALVAEAAVDGLIAFALAPMTRCWARRWGAACPWSWWTSGSRDK